MPQVNNYLMIYGIRVKSVHLQSIRGKNQGAWEVSHYFDYPLLWKLRLYQVGSWIQIVLWLLIIYILINASDAFSNNNS